MTLVKFDNERKNILMPGVSDVFDAIINDIFFTDRTISRVAAVNISERENNYHV